MKLEELLAQQDFQSAPDDMRWAMLQDWMKNNDPKAIVPPDVSATTELPLVQALIEKYREHPVNPAYPIDEYFQNTFNPDEIRPEMEKNKVYTTDEAGSPSELQIDPNLGDIKKQAKDITDKQIQDARKSKIADINKTNPAVRIKNVFDDAGNWVSTQHIDNKGNVIKEIPTADREKAFTEWEKINRPERVAEVSELRAFENNLRKAGIPEDEIKYQSKVYWENLQNKKFLQAHPDIFGKSGFVLANLWNSYKIMDTNDIYKNLMGIQPPPLALSLSKGFDDYLPDSKKNIIFSEWANAFSERYKKLVKDTANRSNPLFNPSWETELSAQTAGMTNTEKEFLRKWHANARAIQQYVGENEYLIKRYPKGFSNGYAGNTNLAQRAMYALGAGLLTLERGFTGTAGFFAPETFQKDSRFWANEIGKVNQLFSMPTDEAGVIENLKKGEHYAAFESVLKQTTQNLPTQLTWFASLGLGAALTGTTVLGNKYADLKEAQAITGMSDAQIRANAAITAAFEVGSEFLGNALVIGKWKKLAKQVGAAEFKKMLTNTIKKNVLLAMGENTALGFASEGWEGAFSQLGGNIADRYTGFDTSGNLMDGVLEAFVSEGASAVITSGIGIGKTALHQLWGKQAYVKTLKYATTSYDDYIKDVKPGKEALSPEQYVIRQDISKHLISGINMLETGMTEAGEKSIMDAMFQLRSLPATRDIMDIGATAATIMDLHRQATAKQLLANKENRLEFFAKSLKDAKTPQAYKDIIANIQAVTKAKADPETQLNQLTTILDNMEYANQIADDTGIELVNHILDMQKELLMKLYSSKGDIRDEQFIKDNIQQKLIDREKAQAITSIAKLAASSKDLYINAARKMGTTLTDEQLSGEWTAAQDIATQFMAIYNQYNAKDKDKAISGLIDLSETVESRYTRLKLDTEKDFHPIMDFLQQQIGSTLSQMADNDMLVPEQYQETTAELEQPVFDVTSTEPADIQAQIEALGGKIAAGEQNFTPEDLQLYQNYTAEIKGYLEGKKTKEPEPDAEPDQKTDQEPPGGRKYGLSSSDSDNIPDAEIDQTSETPKAEETDLPLFNKLQKTADKDKINLSPQIKKTFERIKDSTGMKKYSAAMRQFDFLQSQLGESINNPFAMDRLQHEVFTMMYDYPGYVMSDAELYDYVNKEYLPTHGQYTNSDNFDLELPQSYYDSGLKYYTNPDGEPDLILTEAIRRGIVNITETEDDEGKSYIAAELQPINEEAPDPDFHVDETPEPELSDKTNQQKADEYQRAFSHAKNVVKVHSDGTISVQMPNWKDSGEYARYIPTHYGPDGSRLYKIIPMKTHPGFNIIIDYGTGKKHTWAVVSDADLENYTKIQNTVLSFNNIKWDTQPYSEKQANEPNYILYLPSNREYIPVHVSNFYKKGELILRIQMPKDVWADPIRLNAEEYAERKYWTRDWLIYPIDGIAKEIKTETVIPTDEEISVPEPPKPKPVPPKPEIQPVSKPAASSEMADLEKQLEQMMEDDPELASLMNDLGTLVNNQPPVSPIKTNSKTMSDYQIQQTAQGICTKLVLAGIHEYDKFIKMFYLMAAKSGVNNPMEFTQKYATWGYNSTREYVSVDYPDVASNMQSGTDVAAKQGGNASQYIKTTIEGANNGTQNKPADGTSESGVSGGTEGADGGSDIEGRDAIPSGTGATQSQPTDNPEAPTIIQSPEPPVISDSGDDGLFQTGETMGLYKAPGVNGKPIPWSGKNPLVYGHNGQNLDLRQLPDLDLTIGQRKITNKQAEEIVSTHFSEPASLSAEQIDILRQHTGQGGLSEYKNVMDMTQFYTPYSLIRTMFDVIKKSATVRTALESAGGVGNFIGNAPELDWTAIDLDETNSKILTMLYPNAEIYGKTSYEQLGDLQKDLVISNPPFYEKRGDSSRYPEAKSLHGFYMIRQIDHVKPGGIVANVISHHIMDQKTEAIRKAVIDKANVLACFRLPEGYFRPTSKTDVITDLIFLQRRPDGVEPDPIQQGINEAWVKLRVSPDNPNLVFPSYYDMFPEHVLGDVIVGKNKLFGGEEMYQVMPWYPQDIARSIKAVNKRIAEYKFDRYVDEYVSETMQPDNQDLLPSNNMTSRQFSEYVESMGLAYQPQSYNDHDGIKRFNLRFARDIMFHKSDIYLKQDIINITDTGEVMKTYALLDNPHTHGVLTRLRNLDDYANRYQETYNKAYADMGLKIISEYKQLYLVHPNKDKELQALFDAYPVESPYWKALTSYFDEDFKPAAVFSEITKHKSGKAEVTADSPLMLRALANEDSSGKINLMTSLKYLSESDVPALIDLGYAFSDVNILQNGIFYYSGDIYPKLDKLDTMINRVPPDQWLSLLKIQRNKLVQVMPPTIAFGDIALTAKELWLNDILDKPVTKIVENKTKTTVTTSVEFTRNYETIMIKAIKASYDELHLLSSTMKIPENTGIGENVHQLNKIYNRYMNNKTPINKGQEQRTEDYEHDLKICYEMIAIMAREFKYQLGNIIHLGKSASGRNIYNSEVIEDYYNRTFNGYVPTNWADGSYLIQDVCEIAEANAGITLNEHQRSWAVQASYVGVSANCHGVGAGKTYASILLGMVLKSRGTAKKPLYIAEGKNIMKFSKEMRKMMGKDAKILVVQSLTPQEKSHTLSGIANNNWDAILITPTALKSISFSPDYMLDALYEYSNEIAEQMDLKESKNRDYAKAMENLNSYIAALEADIGKIEPGITFEQLGIDCVIADEAHMYKAIPYAPGLAQGEVLGESLAAGTSRKTDSGFSYQMSGSTQAMHFRMLCDFIASNNKGNNVFILTATPSPNKPLELYTMFRHLGKRVLASVGINGAKEFVNNFYETQKETPFKYSFTGITKYNALRAIMTKFMDYRKSENLGLILPIQKTVIHTNRASAQLSEIITACKEAIDFAKDPLNRDIPGVKGLILTAFGVARTSSIDPRLAVPRPLLSFERVIDRTHNAKTDKIQSMVEQVVKSYKEHKQGQLVFCDFISEHELVGDDLGSVIGDTLSTMITDVDEIVEPEPVKWNTLPGREKTYLPGEIKKSIMDATGLSDKEVCLVYGGFITNPQTGKEIMSGSAEKKNALKYEIQEAYNSGIVKIVIGNIKSMGQGMDLNKYSTDVHMVNVPWTGDEIEQAIGRARRQGNTNKEIKVHYYLTAGTLDNLMLSTVQRKVGWQSRLFSFEDTEYMPVPPSGTGNIPSPEEMEEALITDPIRKFQMRLINARNRMLKAEKTYEEEIGNYRYRIYKLEQTINNNTSEIARITRRLDPQTKDYEIAHNALNDYEKSSGFIKDSPEHQKLKRQEGDEKSRMRHMQHELRALERANTKAQTGMNKLQSLKDMQEKELAALKTEISDHQNKYFIRQEVEINNRNVIQYVPREPNQTELAEIVQEIGLYDDEVVEAYSVKRQGDDMLMLRGIVPVAPRGDYSIARSYLKDTQEIDETVNRQIDPSSPVRLQLPELVKLVKELSGKYPIVKKRMPSGLQGYFRHMDKTQDMLHTLIVLNSNLADEGHAAFRTAEKTLAHEIGHMIDYIGQWTTKGTLLNKLYLVTQGVLTRIAARNSGISIADVEAAMKIRKNLLAMRLRAYKGVDTKYSLDEINRRLDIIEDKYLAVDSSLKDELWNLSVSWSPLPLSTSSNYISYRKRPGELYADFVSVLLNQPELARSMAPKFYKLWFETIHNKPEVEDAYNAILDRLYGNVLEDRLGDIQVMWENAGERERAKREFAKRWYKDQWQKTKDLFVSKMSYLRQIENQLEMPYEDRVSNMFQTHNYMNQRIRPIMRRLQNIRDMLHKMDITDDEFDTFLFLRQSETNRKFMFNPMGFNPETATETLEELRQRVGQVRYNQMDTASRKLQEWWLTEVIEPAIHLYGAEKVEEFNDRFWKDDEIYTPVFVQKYYEKMNISSSIRKANGTVQERMKPLTSMTQKAIAIMYDTDSNEAKRMLFRNVLSKLEEGVEWEKAVFTRKQDKAGNLFTIPPNPVQNGMKLITWKENGTLRGVYVNPHIYNAVSTMPNETIRGIAEYFQGFTKLFRNMYVTLKPAFQIMNLPRDYWRTLRNMQAMGIDINAMGLIAEYVKTMPVAWKRAWNIYDPLIEEMEINSALLNSYSNPFKDFAEFDRWTKKTPEIDKLMAEYKVTEANYGVIIDTLTKIMGIFKGISDIGETLPKATAYRIIKEKYMGNKDMPFFANEKTIGEFVRGFVGTPDFAEGGTATQLLNQIFLFCNVAIQGYRADLSLALGKIQGHNTAAAYWMNMVRWQVFPKMIMAAMEYGIPTGILASLGMGDDWDKWSDKLKQMMRAIPVREKANYYVIPIGQDNTKTIYLRFAMDETSRLFSGMLYNAMTKRDFWTALQSASDYGIGQLPTWNPVFVIANNWMSLSRGKIPYDPFLDRPILTDDEMKDGGWWKYEPMLRWTAQKLGLPLAAGTRIGATELEKKIDKYSWLGIKRLVRVSNYGLTESIANLPELTAEQRTQAHRRLLTDEFVKQYVTKAVEEGGTYEAVMYNHALMLKALSANPETPLDKARITQVSKAYIQALLKSKASVYLNSLTAGKTNREKAIILADAKENLENEDFRQLLLTAYAGKFISDETLKELQVILLKPKP